MGPGAIAVTIILSIVAFVLLVEVARSIRSVRQGTAVIIERMGRFHTIWQSGLHMKCPFIDKVARTVSMMEQVGDFPPHPVITKDNVTMQIDTIVFFQVTDPKLFAYGVERPLLAIEKLTATTLRNIVGEMELDNTLTSRDYINIKIRNIIDEATDPWGIKVNRVELKSITPPRAIQEAMEKQMRAERERRELILRAEGEKASKILIAEGEKERQITEAQGIKQSMILRAEADKEAQIRKAEGEAEAIRQVQEARAEAVEMINKANPGQAYLAIEALNAFIAAADGKATKIIIPSEIQGLAGLAKGLTEVIAND
ncbi:MAG: SPFH/Band 7/PHB domain protein [Oscillospiraceae bacterium]|nr:SPFH/Band 7/PHB domain protein [Oscillospiraceae bacterium]